MIRLIGVGNPWRRDDGVGIWIAWALAKENLPGVEVLECRGEGTDLLAAWRGGQTVYLFDALYGDDPPGTVRRLAAHRERLPREGPASSHAMGVAQAVELARTLGQLPPRLIVYGVTGVDFGWGEGLTPAVAAGAREVVERVLVELSPRLAGDE